MSVSTSKDASSPREPAWEIARLFPDQGTWSVDDYLELTNSSNQRVEFDDGNIELLAMPTEAHELIIRFLFLAPYNFVTPKSLGEAEPFVAGTMATSHLLPGFEVDVTKVFAAPNE